MGSRSGAHHAASNTAMRPGFTRAASVFAEGSVDLHQSTEMTSLAIAATRVCPADTTP